MENKLNLVPVFNAVYGEEKHTQYPKADGETNAYSSVTYQHGYGQLVKAGAYLTPGVKGTVEIDLELETYDSSSYEASTKEVKNSVSSEVHEHLEETERSSNYSDWWFWLASFSSKDYEHLKNSSTSSISFSDESITDSLTKNFSENKKNYSVKGSFTVEATSDMPVMVYLYIEMLNVTTADGSTTSIINSTPVAADENGDVSKAKVTDGKLNIIPIAK